MKSNKSICSKLGTIVAILVLAMSLLGCSVAEFKSSWERTGSRGTGAIRDGELLVSVQKDLERFKDNAEDPVIYTYDSKPKGLDYTPPAGYKFQNFVYTDENGHVLSEAPTMPGTYRFEFGLVSEDGKNVLVHDEGGSMSFGGVFTIEETPESDNADPGDGKQSSLETGGTADQYTNMPSGGEPDGGSGPIDGVPGPGDPGYDGPPPVDD